MLFFGAAQEVQPLMLTSELSGLLLQRPMFRLEVGGNARFTAIRLNSHVRPRCNQPTAPLSIVRQSGAPPV